ncbi:hypothetical protein [Allocoleopsis sp.]|uniref:hypothetical protein n=1 Tax=Allocoleopsis sp. TaxID=3088169 RepID=UPI002FD24D0D
MGGIAVAKAIRTNPNSETLTRQYASLLPSALWPLPFAIHAIAGSTVKLLARHERAGVVRTEVVLA